jgi:hypothetical protein
MAGGSDHAFLHDAASILDATRRMVKPRGDFVPDADLVEQADDAHRVLADIATRELQRLEHESMA